VVRGKEGDGEKRVGGVVEGGTRREEERVGREEGGV